MLAQKMRAVLAKAMSMPYPFSDMVDKARKGGIRLEALQLDLAAQRPEEAIRQLLEPIRQFPALKDADRILRQILEREGEMSTCFGHLAAFPHARTEACQELVISAGRLARPIQWGSQVQEAQLVFLLVVPLSAINPYLATMRDLTHAFRKTKLTEQLLEAKDEAAFLEAFNRCLARV